MPSNVSHSDHQWSLCNTRSFRLVEHPLYQFSVVRMHKPGVKCFVDCLPHWHDFIQIWYVKEGYYSDRLNNRAEHMSPGAMMIVPPFHTHHPKPSHLGMIDAICFDLSLEFLEALFEDKAKTLPFLTLYSMTNSSLLHLPIDQIEQFETLIYELAAAYEQNSYKCIVLMKDKILAVFHFILEQLRAAPYNKQEKLVSKHYNTIKNILEYIDDHFAEKLNMEDICSRAFMSPSYFSYVFKEITNNTLFEYISMTRVLKARKMLDLTDIPVAEVARKCGFPSRSLLHRKFSYYFGYSPSHYRQLCKLNRAQKAQQSLLNTR